MSTVLTILLILACLGAVVALVRGVVIFLQTSHEEVHGRGAGPSQSALRQNAMMWRRIQFQGAAVVIAVLLLVLSRGG